MRGVYPPTSANNRNLWISIPPPRTLWSLHQWNSCFYPSPEFSQNYTLSIFNFFRNFCAFAVFRCVLDRKSTSSPHCFWTSRSALSAVVLDIPRQFQHIIFIAPAGIAARQLQSWWNKNLAAGKQGRNENMSLPTPMEGGNRTSKINTSGRRLKPKPPGRGELRITLKTRSLHQGNKGESHRDMLTEIWLTPALWQSHSRRRRPNPRPYYDSCTTSSCSLLAIRFKLCPKLPF